MKACAGVEVWLHCFLTLGTRWKWVVSLHARRCTVGNYIGTVVGLRARRDASEMGMFSFYPAARSCPCSSRSGFWSVTQYLHIYFCCRGKFRLVIIKFDKCCDWHPSWRVFYFSFSCRFISADTYLRTKATCSCNCYVADPVISTRNLCFSREVLKSERWAH